MQLLPFEPHTFFCLRFFGERNLTSLNAALRAGFLKIIDVMLFIIISCISSNAIFTLMNNKSKNVNENS